MSLKYHGQRADELNITLEDDESWSVFCIDSNPHPSPAYEPVEQNDTIDIIKIDDEESPAQRNTMSSVYAITCAEEFLRNYEEEFQKEFFWEKNDEKL